MLAKKLRKHCFISSWHNKTSKPRFQVPDLSLCVTSRFLRGAFKDHHKCDQLSFFSKKLMMIQGQNNINVCKDVFFCQKPWNWWCPVWSITYLGVLLSGTFFPNTKVFVMTHFFSNGFATRSWTSFPNSLKCTTHIDK